MLFIAKRENFSFELNVCNLSLSFIKRHRRNCFNEGNCVVKVQAINVAPKKVLSAQLGTVWEVVDLLILVHIFYVWRCDVAGPLQVVKLIIRLNHREASMLG